MSLTMENHKNSWIFAWNFFKFANISCGSSSRFSPWFKSQGGDAYRSVINSSPAFSSLTTYLEGSAGSFISSSRAIGRYIEAGGGGKIDSPMGIFWDSGLVAPTLPPVFSFSRASTTFFRLMSQQRLFSLSSLFLDERFQRTTKKRYNDHYQTAHHNGNKTL